MADKRRGSKKKLAKLPKGVMLTDTSKNAWELLEPIGEGGFGVIYNVKKVGLNSSQKKNDIAYAAKLEPHGNGPLFVEKNFFLRNLKPVMIDEWKRKMKLKFLGLPQYIGGGTLTHNDVSYRFLIMERFGENINSKLKIGKGAVNLPLLGTLCVQIIDALMYIHEKGYVHMDIKPENLLLKYNSNDDQVYLIDFGIIDKCISDDELKPDKRKQHNGTLLYSSRDSHLGIGSKRGDLEILGYNIICWIGIQLPWTNNIKTPAVVHEKKINFMEKFSSQLKNEVPKNVIEYLTYVNTLKHNETPDYQLAKSLLSNLGRNTSGDILLRKRKINSSEIISPSKIKPLINKNNDKAVKTKTTNNRSKKVNVADENVLKKSPVKKRRTSRKQTNKI